MALQRRLVPFLMVAALFLMACDEPAQAADERQLAVRIEQLQKEGKFREALPLVKQLAEELRSRKAGQTMEYARVLVGMGALQSMLQDFPSAEESLRHSIEILETIAGPKDRDGRILLATARAGLGSALSQDGKLEEALSTLDSAYQAQTALLGPDNKDTAMILMNEGIVSLQLGKRLEARKQLASAFSVLNPKLPDDSAEKALLRALNGLLLIEDDKPGEAEILLKQALPVLEKSPQHQLLLPQIHAGLAMIAQMRGDLDQAEKSRQRADDLTQENFGVNTPGQSLLISQRANVAEESADLDAALRLRREALDTARKAFGEDDSRSLDYEKQLVSTLLTKGEIAEAGTRLDHIEVVEARKPPGPGSIAETLDRRARLEEDQGNLGKAQELEAKALGLLRSQYPDDHRVVADARETLGVILLRRGDPAGAAPLLTEAYETRSRILEPRDPNLALSRIALAMLNKSSGKIAESDAQLKQVLENLPADKRIARSFSALANTLLALNAGSEQRPRDARVYLERVGNYVGEVFSDKSLNSAESSRTLGILMVEEGDMAGAEPHLRRALDLYLQFSPNSLETARTAMALGMTVLIKDDYAAAEAIFREAITRTGKDAGGGILTPVLSFGLSMALMAEGKPAEAQVEIQHGIDAMDQSSEKSYSLLANFLLQLGNLRLGAGDATQAESFWQRAEETARTHIDPHHPVVAYVSEARARVLAAGSGADQVRAAALAADAVRILDERFGADHPITADALGVQAVVEWTVGHIEAARTALEKRAHAESVNFTRQLVLNDEAGYRNLLKRQSPSDDYLSFHWNASPDDPAAAKLAFEATLQRKGTLQDTLAEHARLQRGAGEGAQLFARWRQAENAVQSCGTARSPLGLISSSAGTGLECSKDILSLTADAGNAYQALIKKVPGLNPKPVELPELAARLHAMGDYTLVEIIEYTSSKPGTDATQMRYAAYLLFADGRISWADLGPQAQIDALVDRLRGLQSDPGSNITAARRAARLLDNLVMEPVRRKLEGRTRLFVASDGELNLIDFSSLVDESGHELIEKYNIAGLTSGRDLLRLDPLPASPAAQDYLFTNPSFLASIEDTRAKPKNAGAATLGAPETEFVNSCEQEFLKENWLSVGFPGTRIENWRRAMRQPVVYEEGEANLNRLFEIKNPRSIWFITHGFFCENGGRGGAETSESSLWRNPMARAAIVLAGASSPNSEARRNGYVTAEQIGELNWTGTELVVLGACQTAVGTPEVGDGVYGLRRALILAGVRSQVMTLWTVEAGATFDVLQAFASRLAVGDERLTALRDAQRKIRSLHAHPYYWAGVTFIGDPGKMSNAR